MIDEEIQDSIDEKIVEYALELIQARTGDATCPMCQTKKWLVESKPGSPPLKGKSRLDTPAPVYLIMDADAFREGPPTIPVAVLTCAHCGFVRLHNIAYLTRGDADGG